MKRRAVLLFFSLSPWHTQLAAGAWPTGKIARVGYLESGVAVGTPFLEAFRQGLRDHGWVEGANLALEIRAAQGRYEKLAGLAADLVRVGVDVIFASSTPAAVAAKKATSTIPIVIGRVADPVASGLVATLARPGGNVTGWTHQGLEMREKYLDVLKDAVPAAVRVGVLWNPGNPIHARSLKSMKAAAQALKVELLPVPAQDSSGLESAFNTLTAARIQALVVFQDGMFLSQGDRIIGLAAKIRVPTVYGATEMVKSGGLMGYGVDLPDMYRHGASYVDRILNGAAPADLPVEQPTKFELVINLKTAKELGLTLPQSVLVRADEVIQ
jgi:putative ABC transport system substrate-binding protein